jgi:hypothetical protein
MPKETCFALHHSSSVNLSREFFSMPVAENDAAPLLLRTPVSAVAAGCGGVGPAAPAPVAAMMSTQKVLQQRHQQQKTKGGIDDGEDDAALAAAAAAAAASAASHGPTPPHELEHSLVERVRSSLDLHMLDNALFLAERLVADFPSEVRLKD